MNWWQDLKREVKFCEPLSEYTTLRVGGVADIWFEPRNLTSLKKVLALCRKKDIPFLVIGNGSNLLVKQGGVRGVVARLSSPYFKELSSNHNSTLKHVPFGVGTSIVVGCGVSLSRLVNFARQRGLGGCEFLAGIPGTIGGALITNAGVRNILSKKEKLCNIGDIVEEVTLIDSQGLLRTLKRKEMKFAYRCSNTLTGTSLGKFVILKAKIKLQKKKRTEIESAIDKFMNYKKTTQGLAEPNAGSIFKNPPNASTLQGTSTLKGTSAARLIELCGLKGFKTGDAQVSFKHANFIINRGKAQAADVSTLIRLIQNRVKAKYGVKLQPEIRIVGE